MVDSRQKGARAEAAIVKLLKEDTGLNWKRVPGSGALHKDHMLKGDVYVPNEKNYWAVEVKHYKDDHLTSKVLTSKDPQLQIWWKQAVRQAEETDKLPILFFKFDRSKWFVMIETEPVREFVSLDTKRLELFPENTIIMEYTEFMKTIGKKIKWIK